VLIAIPVVSAINSANKASLDTITAFHEWINERPF
jgi:hypothetical protein